MKKALATLLSILMILSSLSIGLAEESAAPAEPAPETIEQAVESVPEVQEAEPTGEQPEEARAVETPSEEGEGESESPAPEETPSEEEGATESPGETPTETPSEDGDDASETPAPAETDVPEEEPSESPVLPVEISIAPSAVTLTVSESAQLTGTVLNLLEGQQAVWQSGDETIAGVDETGLVTAHMAGDTVIRLGLGDVFAECAVTVNEPGPEESAPTSGYAVSGGGVLQLYAEDALTEPLALLEGEAVFYVLSFEEVQGQDVASLVVSADLSLLTEAERTLVNEEGLLYAFAEAEEVRLLSQEEIEAYEERLSSGQAVDVPEAGDSKLLPVSVLFVDADALAAFAGPITMESIQVAPLWSDQFPGAFGDAASLAQIDTEGLSLETVLLDAFQTQIDEIDLTGFAWTPGEAETALQALVDDNPALIALSGDFEADVQNDTIVALRPAYRFDAETTQANLAAISSYAGSLATAGNGASSALQKVFWIHNELVGTLRYGGAVVPEDAVSSGAAESQGFAYLMQQALTTAGIPNSIVRSAGMGRAWNLVQVGGEWYHVDASVYAQRGIPLDFTYLMASDTAISGGDLPHSGWLARHSAGSDAYAGYDWISLLPMEEDQLQLLNDGAVVPVPPVETGFRLFSETIQDVLYAGMKNRDALIDVSAFGLPSADIKVALQDTLNLNPELFYVGTKYKNYIGTTPEGAKYVAKVEPTYKYTGDDLTNRIDAFNASTQAIIDAVPSGATDLQKALFINDYFTIHYGYDTIHSGDDIIYSPDLLFSEGIGVCQAYTLAFQHLMNKMGVPCSYASSTSMNHIWNMVEIDSSWYHVDVTWNDPISGNADILGYAGHSNFLCSDAGITATGHSGWDQTYTAGSTTYDNYFWKNLQTAFAPLNGKWYFTQKASSTAVSIMEWNGSDNAPIQRFTYPASWGTGSGCPSGVIVYKGKLLYNTNEALYSVGTDGTGNTPVYTPKPGSSRLLTGLYQTTYMYYIDAISPRVNAKAIRIPTNGDGSIVQPVFGIQLSQTSYTLAVGSTYKLEGMVQPAHATDQNVTWSSSAPDIAAVSTTGMVQGLKGGTAIITVTTADGGFTASCTVSVRMPVSSVSLSSTQQTIIAGTSTTLTATVLPADATDKNITWSSTNPSVASVADGVVRGLSEGTAIITVATQDGGYIASCQVQVPPAVNGVSLNSAAMDMEIGGTHTLTATVSPSNAGIQALIWSSGNEAVAKVSSTGAVTAVSAGSTVIIVTTVDGGFSASCIVTVTAPLTPMEQFAKRLYVNVLNRQPDTSWESWIEGLTNGSETGASAVRGFFLSAEFEAQNTSNSEFVTLVYQTCMDREPEADEVAYWTAYLDQGIGRAAVLNEFVNSPEYGLICGNYGIIHGTMPLDAEDQDIQVTQFVHRLYTIILNRQPESSGVRYWTDYLLNQDGDGKTTAYEFAFSQEFLMAGLSDEAFVTRMYRALLDREPEPAGMQDWLNEIALNGREGIFNGFADGPEFALIMITYGVK